MTGDGASRAPEDVAVGRRRGGRVAGAAVLLLAAVVVLLMAQRLISLHYSTPQGPPGGTLSHHSIVWGPGVAATVLAAVAVLSSVGWLIANWVTRPPGRFWWLFGGLVLLAGIWTAVTGTMDTPKF